MKIRLSPDGDDGGGAAAPAPSLQPPGVTVKSNAGTGAPAGPKPVGDASAAPAKSRMEMLAARANVDPPKPKDKPANPDLPKPPENREPPKPADGAKPADKPADAAPVDAKPGEKSKVNPWKERDKERARADAAEARLRELEAAKLKEEDRAVLESTRRRNDELENEIRFVNYEKSKEFQDKYHKPYQDKYDDAMHLFSRIPITDAATGQQRAANEQDLFELMNLNPVDADARALEMAGGKQGLADRMVRQAEQVAEVLKARGKALEDAKANGKTRETEMQQRTQAQQKALNEYASQVAQEALAEWNKDPDAALFDQIKPREDGQELTPDEQEHNAIVAKGKELAKVFEKRFSDCKTKEEARALIRKGAAAVMRAAHFGALRRLYHKQGKELTALKAELAKFQETTPLTTGRQPGGSRTNGSSPSDGRRERLAKFAGR